MSEEAKFYNALNIALQSESSNYNRLKSLFDKYGSWQKAWQISNYNTDAGIELEKLNKLGINLITQNDPVFPRLLKEIPWPPLAIYMKGAMPDKRAVAIVGTRKATATGVSFAQNIAKELSQFGIAINSGLALGIDESAHKGAIEANGQTVAVLAVGLDKVYPAKNSQLAQKILESGGALISEYPLGSTSYPSRFIERNRIISGLSDAVIVIEAPEKSGALATARFAVEQNRDVLVVPGPAGHLNYAGSCKLIRSGASLINSTEDILEDLGIEAKSRPRQTTLNLEGLSSEQKQIIEALKLGEPLDIDSLAQSTALDIKNLNRNITFLLIKGILKESGSKYYL